MDQGGTVRVHKAPEKTKVNTAELFAGGWKLLREIVPKECKDCSEWHKDKERRLKICQDLYRECLKRQDDMWFWGDVALNVKYGTLIAIGLLSSKVPVPGVVNIVNMGFDIADYPNAYAHFENEISLPLHTCLTDEDVQYVVENYLEVLRDYLK